MSVEDIKAKGLKAWYVKDKKSGKYVSTKHDGSYDFVDVPYLFCMSLEGLRNGLIKPHLGVYNKDGKLNTIITTPLNIDDLEIIEA